jgi:DNA-directed RNA polymerase specialized sigma24 family protein
MNRHPNTRQFISALFPEGEPPGGDTEATKRNSSAAEKSLREIGETLHRRLLNQSDSSVTASISELFFPLLVKSLKASFHYFSDAHIIETVAEDTLINYLTSPEKFDPAKRSLIGYLYMDAYWDVKNLIEKPKKVVELYPHSSEYEVNAVKIDNNPEQVLLERETQLQGENSDLVRITRSVIADPVDREVLELMMEGVRETQRFAEVLKLEELPPEKQASIVKKHKDRIKKSIQRALKRRA